MTYSEALAYLYGFIDYEKIADYTYDRRSMNLDREAALLDSLGNPHRALHCIHIAGSKGKGSTAAMADSMLRALGHRVGLYTSPHLVDFRERIRVDGRPIAEEELCEGVQALMSPVEEVRKDPALGEITFWELWTAIAFRHIARQSVDFAVIEVGLGGRLDATNVISPAVTAITTLGLEHTDKLGATLAEIAGEKAGIIKQGVPVVAAPLEEEARAVVRCVAAERNAPLIEVGHDVLFGRVGGSLAGEVLSVTGPYGRHPSLEIPLVGEHQTINAATAVTVVDLCCPGDAPGREQAIRRGLKSTVWPGRFQVVQGQPTVVLDGAHTPQSAACLRETVLRFFPGKRVILVFGMNADKQMGATWNELAPIVDVAVLTRADSPRAAAPDALRAAIGATDRALHAAPDCPSALALARSLAHPNDLIVATGSLYVVGEMIKHLGLGSDLLSA